MSTENYTFRFIIIHTVGVLFIIIYDKRTPFYDVINY